MYFNLTNREKLVIYVRWSSIMGLGRKFNNKNLHFLVLLYSKRESIQLIISIYYHSRTSTYRDTSIFGTHTFHSQTNEQVVPS